ncbi:MAG: Co2+/Mg2+ efflux protein ApaG [Myxococcales bacterium]|nr:Co2+/Mg2+ efflux protein ApaG [Myxococcales bacterium]
MYESEAVTRGVRVHVRSFFIPERSDPSDGRWLFAYRITIANESSDTVQLLNRHWVIVDGNGEQEEVRGPGVVGEQPVLAPGESFEYTSGCPLGTPVGTMTGSYEMQLEDGTTFEAEIATFTLAEGRALN